MKRIKFGVFLPFYAFRINDAPSLPYFNLIRDIVLECEHLGYHSAWLDDHLMFENRPILESWTTLSALSSVTEKIRLGTMVTCNSFRNPALLAKMAATLDLISNGRLEFGIGAGITGIEHVAYGLSFPKTSTRIARLKEAIEIIKKMWTEEKVSYTGKHYEIREAVCEPKPIQKPHPPITIGGSGEELMLKVTAQHANRYDWGFLSSLKSYKRKLKVLETHCLALGREFQEIEKSSWPGGKIIIGANRRDVKERLVQNKPAGVSMSDFKKFSLAGTPEDCTRKIKQYVDLGVTYIMLFFGDLPDLSGIRLFAKTVIEKFT